MLLLLNTTKTMDLRVPVLKDVITSDPDLLSTAQILAGKVSKMTPQQLAELMSLSDKLAAQTHERFSLWGEPGQSKIPALFGFTGLIFKHLDAASLSKNQLAFARKNVRILSGLYGLLEPFDLIELYRLEMGYKLAVGGFSNLVQFWREVLTTKLNNKLTSGESIVSVASQEYMKALDIKGLDHPVIIPVFKEKHPDGSYKNVIVHAKKARGAIIRYAIENRAEGPKDLMRFSAMGWKAVDTPPDKGSWLFTRPVK
ncbi:MAG: YaaA family protein [Desulfobacteraceae bacterium]|nr:YaaA family protein [Desulfobacteraceae bacterium]